MIKLNLTKKEVEGFIKIDNELPITVVQFSYDWISMHSEIERLNEIIDADNTAIRIFDFLMVFQACNLVTLAIINYNSWLCFVFIFLFGLWIYLANLINKTEKKK